MCLYCSLVLATDVLERQLDLHKVWIGPEGLNAFYAQEYKNPNTVQPMRLCPDFEILSDYTLHP